MNHDQPDPPNEADATLERDIRAERPFSLADAIGRLAGPGIMKGVSPVSRRDQTVAEISEYLRRHLTDTAGVLSGVLVRQVEGSDLLLSAPDRPHVVLAGYVRR